MKITRRSFIKSTGLSFAGIGVAGKKKLLPSFLEKNKSEKLLLKNTDQPKPAPINYDRLPIDWYKKTIKRLRENAAARGVDAVILADSWNMNYFTGNFMTRTERPCTRVGH